MGQDHPPRGTGEGRDGGEGGIGSRKEEEAIVAHNLEFPLCLVSKRNH